MALAVSSSETYALIYWVIINVSLMIELLADPWPTQQPPKTGSELTMLELVKQKNHLLVGTKFNLLLVVSISDKQNLAEIQSSRTSKQLPLWVLKKKSKKGIKIS